jgi:hypothetical protein
MEAFMDSRHLITVRGPENGRRLSRLGQRGTGSVLALAALLLLGTPVTARETAPTVAPAGEADVVYLFIQSFASGTWQPKEDEEGVFLLTLNDIGAETIYFSDRPARQVGLMPTGEFLDSLGFTPANPPNAALATETETGERDVLVIELFAPVYAEAEGTLTYEAVLLAEYGEAALADLAQHATGELLPATFGRGHLFIDSCADEWWNCIPM